MAAKYRCDLDFPATFPVVERHGLSSDMAAASPEELETLLEDAVLLHDDGRCRGPLRGPRMLVTEGRCLHGHTSAAQVLAQRDYVAAVRSVAVVGDLAVVVGEQAVNVSRRGPDRRWRLAVVVVQSPR